MGVLNEKRCKKNKSRAKYNRLKDQRLNTLKVKYALSKHSSANNIVKQLKNVENVFANDMRNILSNLGPTSNRRKFSKTRKRTRGG